MKRAPPDRAILLRDRPRQDRDRRAFRRRLQLERTLEARGKTAELEALQAQAMAPGSIVTVRQQVPMGLGHAIWCARAFVGDDPFAILLPDDLMMCDVSCTAQARRRLQGDGG